MRTWMIPAIVPLLSIGLLGAGPPPRNLDLTVESDRALAFLLTRGSTDPTEGVVFHWTGTIHARIPADPGAEPRREFSRPILHFEGFNVAHFYPGEEPNTTRMLSRELGLYLDPETGGILDCWNNPFTGKQVTVLPVLNDPVNLVLGDAEPAVLGDDVVWSFEIPLAYPSPLPVDEYPRYSASNTYESLEIFDLVASATDLADPSLSSVPVTLAWTRVGQWLPWMQMGQHPGQLVYHVTGRKLPGGFPDLPQRLRDYVHGNAEAFASAPVEDLGQPNATSWTVFHEHLTAGAYSPECALHAADPASPDD